MRKVLAWLVVATLFMLVEARSEAANDVLKPYVVMILDTSDSMLIPTTSGPTSCGKVDTRLNHATCAIRNIVQSYGDMVFSLGRFREITNGTVGAGQQCDADLNQNGNVSDTIPPAGGDQCNTQGAYCADCDTATGLAKTCTYCTSNAACGAGGVCNTNGGKNYCFNTGNACNGPDVCDQPTGRCRGLNAQQTGVCQNGDDEFELLAPLVDGSNSAAALFVDGGCTTCGAQDVGTADPEIWGVGRRTYTPYSGALAGVKQYWEGEQSADSPGTTIWADTKPGFDPINRDPANDVFLPGNSAARCNANPSSCAIYAEGVTYVSASNSYTTNPAACTDALDNEVTGAGVNAADGRINDGCPAFNTPETICDEAPGTALNVVDNDGDGFPNDGCAAICVGENCCCKSQCRPYITILLADGAETCTKFDGALSPGATGNTTVANTAALLNTKPRYDQIAITSISRVGTTLTVTTAVPHAFKVGDEVRISSTGVTALNGTATTLDVTIVNSTTQVTIFDNRAGGNLSASTGFIGHSASLFNYRVATVPIGFGALPGDFQIESLAHAGGAPDVPGVDEGYYAADEADIQLAISEILANSVRSEICNSQDDDCDERIDEDFLEVYPTPQSCTNGLLGACIRTGVFECDGTGGVRCNAPSASGTPEVCNRIDDDCNGLIDDGITCTTCTPTAEVCDGNDQDCDDVADRTCRCSNNGSQFCNPNDGNGSAECGSGTCQCSPALTRPCGIGVCPGVETCTSGAYAGCTAVSNPESCDGLDNDCDGICDGFDLACSEQVTVCDPNVAGSCPATDSLGHSSKSPIAQNICRPGVRTCPVKDACTAGNSYGFCSGEVVACGPDVGPGAGGCDTCDGLDNDCDNEIDENFTPASCGGSCGVGMTECVAGNIRCSAAPTVGDSTCNNIDDDCDNKVDEDWKCAGFNSTTGKCPACGSPSLCNGEEKCINGATQCVGVAAGTEVCNCMDDDCDGTIDEDPSSGAICPGNSVCTDSCQCAFGCVAGEFPCPLGKRCKDNFCVNDPCFEVTCPAVNGNQRTCIPNPTFPNESQCVDVCSLINNSDTMDGYPPCSAGFVCVGMFGECRPNNCSTFPDMCTGAQSCVNGVCVSNPCDDVTCDTGKYCVGGACVPSCADVECPTGQRCRQGACQSDPCGEPCPFGQACNDDTGQCIEDPCKSRQCPSGQWCNPNEGQCEDDPCVASDVTCPNAGEVCRGGTCYDPDDLRPDAAGEAHVTVGGGGGCSTTGGGAGLLLALGLLLTRRRRSVGGAL